MSNLTQIVGYESYYLTEDGDVISTKGLNDRKLKQQKATQSKKGYYQVRLFKESKGKLHYIHRLMWMTFRGEIPKDKQIDHIDGDTSNNRIENLQLVSHAKNMKKYHHNSRSGRIREQRDNMIIDKESGMTYRGIAKKYNCSESTAYYTIKNLVLQIRDGKGTHRPYTKD